MMVPGQVTSITSVKQLENIVSYGEPLNVSFFWADFHEPSSPGGQLDVFFTQLATLHPLIRFFKIPAEEITELSEKFDISVVPTFIFAQGKNVLDKLEGSNVADLAKRIDVLSRSASSSSLKLRRNSLEELSEPMKDRLRKLVSASPVMLFMKGNPTEPKCGFSKKAVALLNEENISFGSFDILSDLEVREALKRYSDWPTYPQIYVHGKLIGGLDILNEMKEDGNLAEQLGLIKHVEEENAQLHDNLRRLINSAPVLLFMKGNPQKPQCGFSSKIIAILREQQIHFSTFDILENEEVRQGLKEYSNWPTYPQLYVGGKLIGGLDIIAEMAEAGSLAQQLGVEKIQTLDERLTELINRAPVMVFIKGTPSNPQCGFSNQLINILSDEGFQFDYFNILSDEKIRQGLKSFSNWPTFPQLYIKGQLIGGLDIVKELKDDGELARMKPSA